MFLLIVVFAEFVVAYWFSLACWKKVWKKRFVQIKFICAKMSLYYVVKFCSCCNYVCMLNRKNLFWEYLFCVGLIYMNVEHVNKYCWFYDYVLKSPVLAGFAYFLWEEEQDWPCLLLCCPVVPHHWRLDLFKPLLALRLLKMVYRAKDQW